MSGDKLLNELGIRNFTGTWEDYERYYAGYRPFSVLLSDSVSENGWQHRYVILQTLFRKYGKPAAGSIVPNDQLHNPMSSFSEPSTESCTSKIHRSDGTGSNDLTGSNDPGVKTPLGPEPANPKVGSDNREANDLILSKDDFCRIFTEELGLGNSLEARYFFHFFDYRSTGSLDQCAFIGGLLVAGASSDELNINSKVTTTRKETGVSPVKLAQVQLLFHGFDNDRDGFLNQKELKHVLRIAFQRLGRLKRQSAASVAHIRIGRIIAPILVSHGVGPRCSQNREASPSKEDGPIGRNLPMAWGSKILRNIQSFLRDSGQNSDRQKNSGSSNVTSSQDNHHRKRRSLSTKLDRDSTRGRNAIQSNMYGGRQSRNTNPQNKTSIPTPSLFGIRECTIPDFGRFSLQQANRTSQSGVDRQSIDKAPQLFEASVLHGTSPTDAIVDKQCYQWLNRDLPPRKAPAQETTIGEFGFTGPHDPHKGIPRQDTMFHTRRSPEMLCFPGSNKTTNQNCVEAEVTALKASRSYQRMPVQHGSSNSFWPPVRGYNEGGKDEERIYSTEETPPAEPFWANRCGEPASYFANHHVGAEAYLNEQSHMCGTHAIPEVVSYTAPHSIVDAHAVTNHLGSTDGVINEQFYGSTPFTEPPCFSYRGTDDPFRDSNFVHLQKDNCGVPEHGKDLIPFNNNVPQYFANPPQMLSEFPIPRSESEENKFVCTLPARYFLDQPSDFAHYTTKPGSMESPPQGDQNRSWRIDHRGPHIEATSPPIPPNAYMWGPAMGRDPAGNELAIGRVFSPRGKRERQDPPISKWVLQSPYVSSEFGSTELRRTVTTTTDRGTITTVNGRGQENQDPTMLRSHEEQHYAAEGIAGSLKPAYNESSVSALPSIYPREDEKHNEKSLSVHRNDFRNRNGSPSKQPPPPSISVEIKVYKVEQFPTAAVESWHTSTDAVVDAILREYGENGKLPFCGFFKAIQEHNIPSSEFLLRTQIPLAKKLGTTVTTSSTIDTAASSDDEACPFDVNSADAKFDELLKSVGETNGTVLAIESNAALERNSDLAIPPPEAIQINHVITDTAEVFDGLAFSAAGGEIKVDKAPTAATLEGLKAVDVPPVMDTLLNSENPRESSIIDAGTEVTPLTKNFRNQSPLANSSERRIFSTGRLPKQETLVQSRIALFEHRIATGFARRNGQRSEQRLLRLTKPFATPSRAKSVEPVKITTMSSAESARSNEFSAKDQRNLPRLIWRENDPKVETIMATKVSSPYGACNKRSSPQKMRKLIDKSATQTSPYLRRRGGPPPIKYTRDAMLTYVPSRSSDLPDHKIEPFSRKHNVSAESTESQPAVKNKALTGHAEIVEPTVSTCRAASAEISPAPRQRSTSECRLTPELLKDIIRAAGKKNAPQDRDNQLPTATDDFKRKPSAKVSSAERFLASAPTTLRSIRVPEPLLLSRPSSALPVLRTKHCSLEKSPAQRSVQSQLTPRRQDPSDLMRLVASTTSIPRAGTFDTLTSSSSNLAATRKPRLLRIDDLPSSKSSLLRPDATRTQTTESLDVANQFLTAGERGIREQRAAKRILKQLIPRGANDRPRTASSGDLTPMANLPVTQTATEMFFSRTPFADIETVVNAAIEALRNDPPGLLLTEKRGLVAAAPFVINVDNTRNVHPYLEFAFYQAMSPDPFDVVVILLGNLIAATGSEHFLQDFLLVLALKIIAKKNFFILRVTDASYTAAGGVDDRYFVEAPLTTLLQTHYGSASNISDLIRGVATAFDLLPFAAKIQAINFPEFTSFDYEDLCRGVRGLPLTTRFPPTLCVAGNACAVDNIVCAGDISRLSSKDNKSVLDLSCLRWEEPLTRPFTATLRRCEKLPLPSPATYLCAKYAVARGMAHPFCSTEFEPTLETVASLLEKNVPAERAGPALMRLVFELGWSEELLHNIMPYVSHVNEIAWRADTAFFDEERLVNSQRFSAQNKADFVRRYGCQLLARPEQQLGRTGITTFDVSSLISLFRFTYAYAIIQRSSNCLKTRRKSSLDGDQRQSHNFGNGKVRGVCANSVQGDQRHQRYSRRPIRERLPSNRNRSDSRDASLETGNDEDEVAVAVDITASFESSTEGPDYDTRQSITRNRPPTGFRGQKMGANPGFEGYPCNPLHKPSSQGATTTDSPIRTPVMRNETRKRKSSNDVSKATPLTSMGRKLVRFFRDRRYSTPSTQ